MAINKKAKAIISSLSTLEIAKKNPLKAKKTRLEKEGLKLFVFEKSSFGWSNKRIAEETGYSEIYICNIMKEIDEEYALDLGKDKNHQIKKQIRRLDGITEKLYKKMDETESIKDIIALQGQILKTEEHKAKLQGLFVNKFEGSLDGHLTGNFISSLGMYEDDRSEQIQGQNLLSCI